MIYDPEEKSRRTVYVRGFDRAEITESALIYAFSPFGNVQRVSLLIDEPTGGPRGYAFVEMASEREAQLAIDGLSGKEALGGHLFVDRARPRTRV